MFGKPLIKGTRLTVEYILNLLARGSSATDILDEYEGLMLQDIHAAGRGASINAISWGSGITLGSLSSQVAGVPRSLFELQKNRQSIRS